MNLEKSYQISRLQNENQKLLEGKSSKSSGKDLVTDIDVVEFFMDNVSIVWKLFPWLIPMGEL